MSSFMLAETKLQNPAVLHLIRCVRANFMRCALEHSTSFHYEKSDVEVLEMRSGLEEHGAGGAIRCYTGVSPKHPFPTPSAESALLQHSHARAPKTNAAINAIWAFLFLLCWHHRVETISRTRSSRSLSVSLPFCCQPRERHDMSLAR